MRCQWMTSGLQPGRSACRRWRWVCLVMLFPVLAMGCAAGTAALRSETPPASATMGPPQNGSGPLVENAGTVPLPRTEEEMDPGLDPFLDEDLSFLEEEEAETFTVADPLEPLNRILFQFNDKVYFYFLKPVATVYRDVLPVPVRTAVRHFFDNLGAPIRFANSLLQLKGRAAVSEMGRFVVNTTAGGLGFWDAASRYPGLEPSEEDLGQTLGHWRLGEGFYLVLPLLGPSSLRDAVGFAGDRFLNPITYVEPSELSYGLTGTRIVNNTSLRIGDYEAMKEAALTPYEAFRDGYIQMRRKQIAK